MPYIEQIKLRLLVINTAISAYSATPHSQFMSKKDIENTISALISWRDETELLFNENQS